MTINQNNLECPEITEAMAEGGGRQTPKVVGVCWVCGSQIYDGESYYDLNCIKFCNNYECKYEAFITNTNKYLIDFVTEYGVVSDAMAWYFHNYAIKRGEDND